MTLEQWVAQGGNPAAYDPVANSVPANPNGPRLTASFSDGGLPDLHMDPITGYFGIQRDPSGTYDSTGRKNPTTQAFANLDDSMRWLRDDYGYTGSPQPRGVQTDVQPTDPGAQKRAGNQSAWTNFLEQMGLSEVPQIGQVDLPGIPSVSGSFDPNFINSLRGMSGQQAANIAGFYNHGNWPTMNAAQFDLSRLSPAQVAQMNLGSIPAAQTGQVGQVQNIGAATPQGFDALNFLLSGQGFSPETLARMNAGALDQASDLGAAQRSAARISAEQTGNAGGAAQQAIESQVNRNTAAAQQQALNQIAIQNAIQGIQNLQAGSQMELGRQTSAAGMTNQANTQNALDALNAQIEQARLGQQANQFNAGNQFAGMQQNTQNAQQGALQDASQRFNAMVQNVQNTQQANQQNTQNQQQTQMARAGAQSQQSGDFFSQLMNAMTGRANQADFFNATNQYNQNLNQAQLNRQRDMFNTQTGENRYGAAFNFLGNAANGPGGQYYSQLGAPNSSLNLAAAQNPANSILNLGNQLVTLGTRQPKTDTTT